MFESSIVQTSDENFASKKEIIAYLADLAAQAGKISDVEAYKKAVFAREEIISTAIGYQIAIPHGESDAVISTFVACLKLEYPIMWDSELTNLVFMIGVPLSSRDKEHLKILAMLSRHLMNEEFRNKLQNARNSEEFYQIIKPLEE